MLVISLLIVNCRVKNSIKWWVEFLLPEWRHTISLSPYITASQNAQQHLKTLISQAKSLVLATRLTVPPTSMVHTWTPSKTNRFPLHNSHAPPTWEWGTYLQIMICLIVVVLKRQSAWWFHQQNYRTWKVFARWFLAPINCLNWQPLVGFARGKKEKCFFVSRHADTNPAQICTRNNLTNWWQQHEPTDSRYFSKIVSPNGLKMAYSKYSNQVILLMVQKSCTPVEVGSLSHDLQGFQNISGGWPWDFRTINSTTAVSSKMLHCKGLADRGNGLPSKLGIAVRKGQLG